MRCGRVISCLDAYVDGGLPERRRPAVEVHLATCEACRGRLEEIRGIDERLRGTLPVPPVPGGLAARIMAEARRRESARAPGRCWAPRAWPLFGWMADLSAPMRLAACATVLLALAAGFSLDRGRFSGRDVSIEPEGNLYGIEWFDPAPPGSIGSIYLAMTDRPYEGAGGR